MVWAPAGYIWVKSIAHHGYGIGLSIQNRHFCYHGLGFCCLVFSAVRHKYTAGTDGTIEHFNQSFLGTGIQISQHIKPLFFRICRCLCRTFQHITLFIRNINHNLSLLMCTVGIQESTGNVNNFLISPFQHQTWFLCNNRYYNSFQIFLVGVFHKFIHIFRINNNCHTLLRFRNSDFCSIKTCIFFRNLIQVYLKTSCQLTDCYRHTAGTKVITFFNQFADFFSAEHTLNLTFCRCISFLNFCTADFNRSLCVYLGGTGCTADTVTSGTSAKQDNDITRIGIFSLNRTSGGSTKNSTDFHTFCHIVRMVNFFYVTGGKTNLVTIGTVTMSSASDQFLLRQFTFQCFFHRYSRISRTGHTHGLIYIRTS